MDESDLHDGKHSNSKSIESKLLLSLKDSAHTRNINSETHTRVAEEEFSSKRVTASIEPARTTMRQWKTTVFVNLSDPGSAPARNHMRNEVIEPFIPKYDNYLKF
jgi:hypothetical protein